MEAAENLKLTAENLNSMLTTSLREISAIRKRTRKLKAISILRRRRKKKEIKLEIPSEFKKSTRNLKKILPSGMGSSVITSVVELISILLVGVAINNIEELKSKLQELKTGFDKNFKAIKGIVESVYEGTRGFIALFDSEDRDKQLKEVEQKTKELENLDKEQIDLDKISKKVQKEMEKVESNFKTAEMNAEKLAENFEMKESGVLGTGESYNIIEKDGKQQIEITSADGEVKTMDLEKFIRDNKTEIPNLINMQNGDSFDLSSLNFDTSSGFDLAKLDTNFDESDTNTITYVFTEVRR